MICDLILLDFFFFFLPFYMLVDCTFMWELMQQPVLAGKMAGLPRVSFKGLGC